MSLELVNTLATLGTFLVITASAIAALVQLRHLRQSNQLSGLLSVLEIFQQPRFHELIDFTRSELPLRFEDPAFRAGLERIPIDRREHPEFHVAEMFEEIGSYVRSGLIDEDLFLQGHWYNIVLYWSLLQPSIEICRRSRPYTFENFEFLVARALGWKRRHPRGNYPGNLPRVDVQSARRAIIEHAAAEGSA